MFTEIDAHKRQCYYEYNEVNLIQLKWGIQSNIPIPKVTTQNAKTEWSSCIQEPQGASSEKRSGHIYFMEYNLLHAISKLHHV